MSTLPPWMPQPENPQPVRGGPWFPHVITQVPDGEGNVLVTFAMPDLTTATIRVPQTSWLEGLHLFLPAALMPLMFPPAPIPDPDDASDPDDDE
jgi:hypothetical protein